MRRAAVPMILSLAGSAVWSGCAGPVPDPQAMVEKMRVTATVDAEVDQAARALVAQLQPETAGSLDEDALEDRFDEAEELVEEHPGSAWARTALAMAYAARAPWTSPRDLDDWKMSEVEFLRAERLAPQNPEIALWHARFLRSDSHLEAGAARLEKVLMFEGDRPELLRGLARLRFDLGQERRAIGYDERLDALGAAEPEDLWRLAECRLSVAAEEDPSTGKQRRREGFEAAKAAFERYSELRPDDVQGGLGALAAQSELARMSGSEEDLAALRSGWQRWIQRFPEEPILHHGAGTAAEIAGAPDDAVRSYRQALALDASYLPALLDLAALEAGRGETAQAVTLYRQVLALELPTARGDRLEPDERQAIEKFVAAYDQGRQDPAR